MGTKLHVDRGVPASAPDPGGPAILERRIVKRLMFVSLNQDTMSVEPGEWTGRAMDLSGDSIPDIPSAMVDGEHLKRLAFPSLLQGIIV